MPSTFREDILFPLSEKFLSRNILCKLEKIKQSEKLNPAQRKNKQQQDLFNILVFSNKNIPYYRDLFKTHNFEPDLVLKDINYLKNLPLLTKEIIIENRSRFNINGIRSNFQEYSRVTGGSTGKTLEIVYNKDALDWTSAANLYSHTLCGKTLNQKEFSLLPNFQEHNVLLHRSKERIKDLILNRNSYNITTTSPKDLEKIWNELKKVRPYLVQGHPSTLYILAKYVEQNKYDSKNVFHSFASTGECIDRKKLLAIQNTFNCKVFNRYGNAEFGVIAHSLTDPEKLRVLNDLVLLESQSLGNGLEELISTTLTNFEMPLIRYKTGDFGEVIKEDGHDYIIRLHGRIHDTIEIDGTCFPSQYIQDYLDKIGGVDEFQIINQSDQNLVIKVVSNDESKKEMISLKLKNLLGEKVNILFTNFEGLTRSGWRDKFRYVINE